MSQPVQSPPSSAAEMQAAHGVDGRIRFSGGENGLPKVRLQCGASIAEVYLHGAHVTRWGFDGYDALWLSPDSFFEASKPIRGGIPVCWPQFGPGALPQHGFARNSEWTLHGVRSTEDATVLELALVDSAETRAAWPHAFRLLYTVTVAATTLTTCLAVENTGDAPLEFTTALHSYFRVPHVSHAAVHGLGGLTYLDNLKERAAAKEPEGAVITPCEETDRIYLNTPSLLTLNDGYQGSLTVSKSASLPDAVLWNPWVRKARAMADFSSWGWTSMVCIEAAAAVTPVVVEAGAQWSGHQTFTLHLQQPAC